MLYTRATGARINETKSSFLNLKGLENVQLPWAHTVEHHKTLGITFYSCPLRTTAANWKQVLGKIRGSLIMDETRDLNIKQRIKLINCAVLSIAAYVAQILPTPPATARTIMSTICRYVWKGHIFKVAVGTTTMRPEKGGLGLTDIRKKSTALFIKRTLNLIETQPNSITAALFNLLKPGSLQPPVDVSEISYKLKHIQSFYVELSYLTCILRDKHKRTSKYIVDKLKSTDNQNKMELKYPNKNWGKIWTNINNRILTTDVQASWYRVINNVVSTNEKLYSIGLSATNECPKCKHLDSLSHRFICSGYKNI